MEKKSLIFYHGTTATKLNSIRIKGLEFPYLTSLLSKAEYYADVAAIERGDQPIILRIELFDINKFRVDYNELDEPVLVDEMKGKIETWNRIKKYYNKYANEHPERYNNEHDIVSIDRNDYYMSLETVYSVVYSGVIKPEQIEIV